MIRTLSLTTIMVALAAATPASAQKLRLANDANGNLDALIARHAAANNIPEDLVRRVIKRDSGGRAHVVSAGNYGLMQIKLPTARSMGYTGTAAGLLTQDLLPGWDDDGLLIERERHRQLRLHALEEVARLLLVQER